MRSRILFLSTLITLSAMGVSASAQQTDAVNRIDGWVLEAAETPYFNQEQCVAPADTTYQLRISSEAGTAINQVFLWAGKENGQCNLADNRTAITPNCREVAGNPRTVEPDNLISGLTLQELIDTEVVTCETSGLQGTSYEIYAFRNTDPGSTDVPVTDFGIATPLVNVDVSPPAALNITNGDTLVGQSFVITWTRPTDDIWVYRFYENDVDDASSATLLPGITAGQNSTSQTITAGQLNMTVGDTKYIFVSAADFAFQVASGANGGNEGELSTGTQVNAVETTGVCEATGACTGCSVAPISVVLGDLSWFAVLVGLGFAIALGRRLRR